MSEDPKSIVCSTKQLMGSKFCVLCWPTDEYATYSYRGDSLCRKHFEEAISSACKK